MQKCANEHNLPKGRKCKSAKERTRAQKRAFTLKLHTTRSETTRFGNSQAKASELTVRAWSPLKELQSVLLNPASSSRSRPSHHNTSSLLELLGSSFRQEEKSQQFTYGVVSEGVVAEILRKFCGNLQEIRFIASGKGAEILRKVCGNFVEIAKIFCNDPFPNDPISELLKITKTNFGLQAASGGVGIFHVKEWGWHVPGNPGKAHTLLGRMCREICRDILESQGTQKV